MTKWLVTASRTATEETATIVEARDKHGAERAFHRLYVNGELDWHRLRQPTDMPATIDGVHEMHPDEPTGVETDELAALERAGPLLTHTADRLLDWARFMGGWDHSEWRMLRAAVDLARGGNGGWQLFDWDGLGLEHIERDDRAAIFDSDAEAVLFVERCALHGDARADKALGIHRANEPKIDALRRGDHDPEDAEAAGAPATCHERSSSCPTA